ncbi:MAG TPA: metal ABC transporter substrate-binding protein [Acidimicrobiales bacterium]|nr:metal ABC transporter substrate-binding protein [Acidimicrobiales bacterium]
MRRHHLIASAVLALALLAAACGDGGGAAGSDGGGAHVVVTTSILGDVVANLVGDDARVEVLMPSGADPHEFALSARQAADLREADLVVANGGGFEQGFDDALEAAEADGATVARAADAVELIDGDPHFFNDPARTAVAAEALAGTLAAEVPGLDTRAFAARARAYVAELESLDAEVEAALAAVPAEQRKLVTNHDVFAYFADRYGFTVVGTVIPAVTTQAEPGAGALDELAATIEAEGVPAVFADTSSPESLADTLAAEVGDIEVVELYTESLGEPGSDGDTYVAMVRTNARRIAAALGP